MSNDDNDTTRRQILAGLGGLMAGYVLGDALSSDGARHATGGFTGGDPTEGWLHVGPGVTHRLAAAARYPGVVLQSDATLVWDEETTLIITD